MGILSLKMQTMMIKGKSTMLAMVQSAIQQKDRNIVTISGHLILAMKVRMTTGRIYQCRTCTAREAVVCVAASFPV